jgi:hypothetical protein
MGILDYYNFILESRGDMKCPAILSTSFINKCREINSPISDYLIKMDRKPSSYTFINCGISGETIQYSEAERVVSDLDKIYKKHDSNFNAQNFLSKISNPEPDNDVWSKNRVDIKVGRFIRRFLSESNFTDSQIEDFVNKWKSLSNKGEKFEYWLGQKIPEAYETRNYFGEYSYNPLWNSCMNDRTELVDFYVFIRGLNVVVLLNSDNKILGRALLWEDIEGRKFLDRIYYINDWDYFKFIDLAKKNGWYYKAKNRSLSDWVLNGHDKKIKVKIKYPKEAIQPGMFPYLDTFYFLSEQGFLSNVEPQEGPFFVLNGTCGESEYYSGLRDIYGNDIENEDDYIFSKTQNGLIDLSNSEHVQYDGFDDYIEIQYLKDPKNGFKFNNDEQQWYKKEDLD